MCSIAMAFASVCLAQKTWIQPKTPWGDPDIQGIWPGTAMVGTPLERDKSLGTRAFLTEDEPAAFAVERWKTVVYLPTCEQQVLSRT